MKEDHLRMNKIDQSLTKNFVLRNVAGQSFLIPLNKSPRQLISLNDSAAYIWKNLCAGHTADWCIGTISNKFKIQGKVVRFDIEEFFNKIKHGLVKKVSAKSLNRDLKAKRILIQGSIELTGKCNLNCVHCYAQGERKKKELQLREIKRILDQLVENGCLFLQLTGGECLLRKDFKEIYLYIRQAGIIPTISTNATLFSDGLIKSVVEYPPYYIIVSLYGAKDSTHDQITRTKGSFKKTLANVAKLRERGVAIRFSTVVFKENFSEVQKMRKLAKGINVPIVFYPFLIPALNKNAAPLAHCVGEEECIQVLALNEKERKLFGKTQQVKRRKDEVVYPCNAGLRSFHIDSEGKLYLCKIERSIGFSLLEGSFKNSWQKLAQVRQTKLCLPRTCLNCEQKVNCEVCPPMMRLYESSGCGKIFCRRVKIKQTKD